MGPMTKTKIPRMKTSRTTRYMMLRIPNTSHHRCGDVSRQVLVDVYSKMCAVRNQVSVKREERSARLLPKGELR